MDFTVLLIGLCVVIVLFIVGKIFAILTKVFFIILLVAAIAVGFFFWQNNNKENTNKTSYCIEQTFIN